MSDSDSNHAAGTWGQFTRLLVSPSGLAVMVIVISLVVGGFSFLLNRPMPDRSVTPLATDSLEQESRIWQDPSLLLPLERLTDTNFVSRASKASETNWNKLRHQFLEGSTNRHRQAVLVVVGNGSSSPFGTEQRLRNRVAVLTALRAAGLYKVKASRTSFLLQHRHGDEQQPYLVPFEVFQRDRLVEGGTPPPPDPGAAQDAQNCGPFERVVVFWIQEHDLQPNGLTATAKLLDRLCQNWPSSQTPLKVAIVGPRSSDGLLDLRNAAESLSKSTTQTDVPGWKLLESVRILSCLARVPDRFYGEDSATNTAVSAVYPRVPIENLLRQRLPNLRLDHFGSTDDLLCLALVDELRLRGIDPLKDSILLLSEYDTLYGRSLPNTFKAAVATLRARSDAPGDILKLFALEKDRCASNTATLLREFNQQLKQIQTNASVLVPSVRYYTYLAGLDGTKSTADNPKEVGADSVTSRGRRDAALDQPWGEAQLDYTRRLAEQLGREELGSVGSDQPKRVRAVGLLGSDVFDKLLLLQALRSQMPDALFFTTELDAQFIQPSQTRWTRNVLAAAGFGLEVPQEVATLGLAPFRDSYQTATFIGCYQYLSGRTNLPRSQVQVYEFGRTRVHPLPGNSTSIGTTGFLSRILSELGSARGLSLIGAGPALASIGLFFGVLVAVVLPSQKSPARRMAFTLGGLVLGVVGYLVIAWWFDGRWEPNEVGDGVGVRVSVFLTWIGLCIGFWGMCQLIRGEVAVGDFLEFAAGGILATLMAIAAVVFWGYNIQVPVRADDSERSGYRVFFGVAWFVCGLVSIGACFLWRFFQHRIERWNSVLANLRERQGVLVCQGEDFVDPQTGDILPPSEILRTGDQVESYGTVNYTAMVGLLVLVMATSSWLDDWTWPSWWWGVMILLMGLPVVLPLQVWVSANRLKRLLQTHTERLKLAEAQTTSACSALAGEGDQTGYEPLAAAPRPPDEGETGTTELEPVSSKHLRALLDCLTHGCFAPLERQPVLGALAAVVGSSGFVLLLQLFQQFSAGR